MISILLFFDLFSRSTGWNSPLPEAVKIDGSTPGWPMIISNTEVALITLSSQLFLGMFGDVKIISISVTFYDNL